MRTHLTRHCVESPVIVGTRLQSIGSPTAVIGGGDFNTNVARLSAFANQRKRVSSVEDLANLT